MFRFALIPSNPHSSSFVPDLADLCSFNLNLKISTKSPKVFLPLFRVTLRGSDLSSKLNSDMWSCMTQGWVFFFACLLLLSGSLRDLESYKCWIKVNCKGSRWADDIIIFDRCGWYGAGTRLYRTLSTIGILIEPSLLKYGQQGQWCVWTYFCQKKDITPAKGRGYAPSYDNYWFFFCYASSFSVTAIKYCWYGLEDESTDTTID